MKYLLVLTMVFYTCMAGLPSINLMMELLQFCKQNGQKSVTISYENPESLIRNTRLFFQHLQTRILMPKKLIFQGVALR